MTTEFEILCDDITVKGILNCIFCHLEIFYDSYLIDCQSKNTLDKDTSYKRYLQLFQGNYCFSCIDQNIETLQNPYAIRCQSKKTLDKKTFLTRYLVCRSGAVIAFNCVYFRLEFVYQLYLIVSRCTARKEEISSEVSPRLFQDYHLR